MAYMSQQEFEKLHNMLNSILSKTSEPLPIEKHYNRNGYNFKIDDLILGAINTQALLTSLYKEDRTMLSSYLIEVKHVYYYFVILRNLVDDKNSLSELWNSYKKYININIETKERLSSSLKEKTQKIKNITDQMIVHVDSNKLRPSIEAINIVDLIEIYLLLRLLYIDTATYYIKEATNALSEMGNIIFHAPYTKVQITHDITKFLCSLEADLNNLTAQKDIELYNVLFGHSEQENMKHFYNQVRKIVKEVVDIYYT